jgi:hypothetical protein
MFRKYLQLISYTIAKQINIALSNVNVLIINYMQTE